MAWHYGIDLGTTNTVIYGYSDEYETPGTTPVPIHYKRSYRGDFLKSEQTFLSMPSVLYHHRYRDLDGTEKEICYVGAAAKEARLLLGGYENYYENAKAELDYASGREAPAGTVTPETIAYELLRTCFESILNSVGKMRFRNCTIGIGYPLATGAKFANLVEKAAFRAADVTGFPRTDENLHFREEPTAALVKYARGEWLAREANRGGYNGVIPEEDDGAVAMVVDLGGGTSDIAIRPLRMKRGGALLLTNEITARTRATIRRNDNPRASFGGMDFDDVIAANLIQMWNRAYEEKGNPCFCTLGPDVRTIRDGNWTVAEATQKRILTKAVTYAVNMKESLSRPGSSDAYDLPPVMGLLSESDPVVLTGLKVTRAEYRSWIGRLIDGGDDLYYGENARDSILRIMEETLRGAHCTYEDLTFLYLTGGMSKVPEIVEMIQKKCRGKTLVIREGAGTVDPLNDIAMGIALCESKRWAPEYEGGGQATLSNAVLIDTSAGGLPIELIPSKTVCPSSARVSRVVYVGDQVVGIRIWLYEGPSPRSGDLRLLNCYPIAKGELIPSNTWLDFEYALDVNRQITLHAIYRDSSGVEHRTRLQVNGNLS